MRRIVMLIALATVPAISQAWTFDTEKDKMGQGEIKMAHVESTNQVDFDFPYKGPQKGQLILRTHPQHGKDVMLQIKKGQFLCRIDGCNVMVRFDEGKPQRIHANPPSDHSSTVIFITGFDRVLAGLRKAKVVRIQAEFYQEGNQVFEFDVAGLGDWPKAPGKDVVPKAGKK